MSTDTETSKKVIELQKKLHKKELECLQLKMKNKGKKNQQTKTKKLQTPTSKGKKVPQQSPSTSKGKGKKVSTVNCNNISSFKRELDRLLKLKSNINKINDTLNNTGKTRTDFDEEVRNMKISNFVLMKSLGNVQYSKELEIKSLEEELFRVRKENNNKLLTYSQSIENLKVRIDGTYADLNDLYQNYIKKSQGLKEQVNEYDNQIKLAEENFDLNDEKRLQDALMAKLNQEKEIFEFIKSKEN